VLKADNDNDNDNKMEQLMFEYDA